MRLLPRAGALLSTISLLLPSAAGADELDLRVLSNRADLLSGGDALVELELPAGVDPSEMQVLRNGVDISGAFAPSSDGRILGILDGLAVGPNLLVVIPPVGDGLQLTLTNHPIGGPVFAGPQVQPWLCSTAAHGLGPPQDAQCNAPAVTSFWYRSLAGVFLPYDPEAPAPDVATTTTDTGETVPYVVRIERGVIDRGIYDIAVLFDPDEPWTPFAPQPAWNGRLMALFGGGTNSHYTQPPPPDGVPGVATAVLDDNALSRGFMVLAQGLNIHDENSNDTVSAEALMMAKEHIAETYGPIVHTIGEGCSGGGLQQYIIAATYPGLLDGIIPTCSYPDIWTTATEVMDCVALNRYFGDDGGPPHPLWPANAQKARVEGHSSTSVCIAWEQLFGQRLDPTVASNCNLPAEQVYDPVDHLDGTRCTIQDYQVAIWGRRAQDGFAKRPFGNEGIQYGLEPLLAGEILPEQFVDLNENLGGFDIDLQPTPERSWPDPGSAEIAYRAGQVTDARVLERTPIIDLRGHDDQEIHTTDWSYVLRARLDAENGHHDNQVIFIGAQPIVGDPAFACSGGFAAGLSGSGPPAPPEGACTHNPLVLMDEWLTAIAADPSDDPLEEKVVDNRPAMAVDTCFINGVPNTDPATCDAAFPYFSNPRVVAGGPFTTDIIQCQLRPLDPADYAGIPVAFTPDQWQRLEAAFPDGVCDWGAPGVGQQPSVPWLTFANGPGGEPLGPPPTPLPEPRPLAGLALGALALLGLARRPPIDLLRSPRR